MITMKFVWKHRSSYTYFSAFAVNLLSYGGGMGYGWASSALHKLGSEVGTNHNPLPHVATLPQLSWIASLLSLGAAVSPYFANILSGKVGRKRALLVFAVSMVLGNFLMLFATEVRHFNVCRFLIGVAEGCVLSTIPVYSAEIAEDHNRGMIGALMTVFICLGHFTSTIIGPWVPIKVLGIISMVPCLLFMGIFGWFAPESPYYWVLRHKRDLAKESLKLLRSSEDVEEELEKIIQTATELKKIRKNSSNPKKPSGIRELLSREHTAKALFLAIGLVIFQQFTGFTYVIDYSTKIFSVAQTSLPANIAVIVVITIQLASISSIVNIIDRVNRKILLYISFCSIAILNFILAIFFSVQQSGVDVSEMSWIPIVCITLLILAYQAGIGPISYIFPTEVLEPNVKSLGTSLAIAFGLLLEFLIVTFFPFVAEYEGFYIPFWVFAVGSCGGFVYVKYCIPETRKKSFLEIQDMIISKDEDDEK